MGIRKCLRLTPEDRLPGDGPSQVLVRDRLVRIDKLHSPKNQSLERACNRETVTLLQAQEHLPLQIAPEQLIGTFTDLADDYPMIAS